MEKIIAEAQRNGLTFVQSTDFLVWYRDAFGDDLVPFDAATLLVLGSSPGPEEWKELAGVAPGKPRAELGRFDQYFVEEVIEGCKYSDESYTARKADGLMPREASLPPSSRLSEQENLLNLHLWHARYRCHLSFAAWTARKILVRRSSITTGKGGTKKTGGADAGATQKDPAWGDYTRELQEACRAFGMDSDLMDLTRGVVIKAIGKLAMNPSARQVDWHRVVRMFVQFRGEDISRLAWTPELENEWWRVKEKGKYNGTVKLAYAKAVTEYLEARFMITPLPVMFFYWACAEIPFSAPYTAFGDFKGFTAQTFDPKLYFYPRDGGKFMRLFIDDSLKEAKRHFLAAKVNMLKSTSTPGATLVGLKNGAVGSTALQKAGAGKSTRSNIQDDIVEMYDSRRTKLHEQLFALFDALEKSELRSSALPITTYINSGVLLLASPFAFGFEPQHRAGILSAQTRQAWDQLLQDWTYYSPVVTERPEVSWDPKALDFVSRAEFTKFDCLEVFLMQAEALVCACSAYLHNDAPDYLLLMAYIVQDSRAYSVVRGLLLQVLHDVILYQFAHPEFDFTEEVLDQLATFVPEHEVWPRRPSVPNRATPDEASCEKDMNTDAAARSDAGKWSKDRYLAQAILLRSQIRAEKSKSRKMSLTQQMYLALRRRSWCQLLGAESESDLCHLKDFFGSSYSYFPDSCVFGIRSPAFIHATAHDLLYFLRDPHISFNTIKGNILASCRKLTTRLELDPDSVLRFRKVRLCNDHVLGIQYKVQSEEGKGSNSTKKRRARQQQKNGDAISAPKSKANAAHTVESAKRPKNTAVKPKPRADFAESIPNARFSKYPGLSDGDAQILKTGTEWMIKAESCNHRAESSIALARASRIFGKIFEKWESEQFEPPLDLFESLRILNAISVLWDDEQSAKAHSAAGESLQQSLLALVHHPWRRLILLCQAKYHLRRGAFLKAEPYVRDVERLMLPDNIGKDGGEDLMPVLQYPLCCDNDLKIVALATPEGLTNELKLMNEELRERKVVDHYCRNPTCNNPGISYRVHFAGLCRLECTELCRIVYHPDCLTLAAARVGLMELREVRGDRDFLCPTPDCTGAIACVEVFDAQNALKTSFRRPGGRPVSLPEKGMERMGKGLLGDERGVGTGGFLLADVPRRKRALFADRKHRVYGCKISADQLQAEVQAAMDAAQKGAQDQSDAASCSSQSPPSCSSAAAAASLSEALAAADFGAGTGAAGDGCCGAAGISSLTGKKKIKARLKDKYKR